MRIQDISPAYQYHVADTTETTSLADQMVWAMEDPDVPDVPEVPDGTDDGDTELEIPYFFEDVYNFLLGNIDLDSAEFMKIMISKLAGLKTEDGTASYFKNYGEMLPIVTLLKERLDQDGIAYGDTMEDLTSRLFSLGVIVQMFSDSIFMPQDDPWGKPGEW